LPILDILLIALVVIALSGLRVAQQYERGVVFRLGRYMGLRGPGLYWIIPLGLNARSGWHPHPHGADDSVGFCFPGAHLERLSGAAAAGEIGERPGPGRRLTVAWRSGAPVWGRRSFATGTVTGILQRNVS